MTNRHKLFLLLVLTLFVVAGGLFTLPVKSFATENIISDTTPTDPTTDEETHLTGSQ